MEYAFVVKMELLKSGALSQLEKEKLKPFWNGKAYIYYKCPAGYEYYVYLYNDNYYQNGEKLNQAELKETDQVSIQRLILELLIRGGQIKKTKARKIIEEIKSGIEYSKGKKVIQYNQDPSYFFQEGGQTWKDYELFYYILQNRSKITKIE